MEADFSYLAVDGPLAAMQYLRDLTMSAIRAEQQDDLSLLTSRRTKPTLPDIGRFHYVVGR
jgi:hypothetical protein